MPLGAARITLLAKTVGLAPKRTANTVTVNNTARISTAQNQFGGSSAFFGGNQDWMIVNGEGLETISGNFSIQFWVYLQTKPVSGYRSLFVQNLTFRPSIFFNNGDLVCNFDGVSFIAGKNYNTGWNYIHFYRNNTNCTLQVNSFQSNSVVRTTDLFPVGSRRISLASEGSPTFNDYLNGYIDEVRVSNVFRGTTIPTSAFVNDANTLLLLHMDGPNNSTTVVDDVF